MHTVPVARKVSLSALIALALLASARHARCHPEGVRLDRPMPRSNGDMRLVADQL
jgi:hypothetical protein